MAKKKKKNMCPIQKKLSLKKKKKRLPPRKGVAVFFLRFFSGRWGTGYIVEPVRATDSILGSRFSVRFAPTWWGDTVGCRGVKKLILDGGAPALHHVVEQRAIFRGLSRGTSGVYLLPPPKKNNKQKQKQKQIDRQAGKRAGRERERDEREIEKTDTELGSINKTMETRAANTAVLRTVVHP